jgi:hypothetical protein
VDGKGIADGILRYWFDNILIIDKTDVLMRTGEHPDMMFNQFLIVPYIGDGSLVEQTMWIDELTVSTSRMVPNNVEDIIEPGLMIYPNPALDYIEIRKPSECWQPSEGSTISIYNTLGECVMDLTPALSTGEGVRIDISNLRVGIYYLRMVNILKFFVVLN